MKILKRIMRNQVGQALPMALILLFVGAMVIIPTLSLTTTNLKATRVIDEKTREAYAADAGIEDALWHLQSEERLALIPDSDWPKTYNLSDNVNARDVSVDINTAWLLNNLLALPALEPQIGDLYYANDHWTVISALNIDVQPRNNYIVDITTKESADTAYVDHIAVWLPQGYSYKPNTVKINDVNHDGKPLLVNEPVQLQHRGGTALIWYYSGIAFRSLSDIAPPPPGGGGTPSVKFPPSVRLSFDYNVTPFVEAKGFFPWIRLTSGRVAWDSDAGFYHIESTGTTPETGTSTTVEAYVPKGVKRYVSGVGGASSAIQGDYIAIGNSLMTCCWNQARTGPPPSGQGCYTSVCSTCCGSGSSANPYRNYAPARVIFSDNTTYPDAERESSATVNTGGAGAVPSDAKIERAYLYWTAWLRGDTLWTERSQTPSWQWTSIMGDDTYWEAHAPQNVRDWLKSNAYDGNAYLAVNTTKVTPKNAGDPAGTVGADTWYISEGSNNVQPSYQYACFADVTAQITEITTALRGTKFTVAGVHAHPDASCLSASPTLDWNRSSNAGWSIIIIYSSAEKQTHQIYLYGGCDHLYNQTRELTIAGFAAPSSDNETNDAKMTVFAAEGDASAAEYLGFKGQNTSYYQLYDVSDTTGVFNSISSASGFTPSTIYTCQATGEISGIDIDTYTRTRPLPNGTPLSTIVHTGDTSANIRVQSTGDGLEVVYVVFSVRSTAVPAGQEFDVGTMMYRIQ